jgi:hypothetical protein
LTSVRQRTDDRRVSVMIFQPDSKKESKP